MEEINTKLQEYLNLLNNLKKYIVDNEEIIREIFLENNRHRLENSKEPLDLLKLFHEVRNKSLDIINYEIEFIERILHQEVVPFEDTKLKDPLIQLINRYLNSLYYCSEDYMNEYIITNFEHIEKNGNSFESIFILAKFVKTSKNIILIGANGSGKSSLANSLKGDEQEVISVIPAQKSLHFSIHDTSVLTSNINELVNALLENNIMKSKNIENGYYDFQYNQFTRLIVALKNDYFRYLVETEQEGKEFDNNHMFSKLKVIFNSIFPDIELRFDTDKDNFLSCQKDGNNYNINALSEGEKATIYYTISVLAAKKNSFIIVDEPETYLNPSLANTLWDYLTEAREDCQFIFITHSIDFVLSRDNSELMWLKSFKNNNLFEIENLNNQHDLPKNLLTEILGSKKSIIFCEGDDKTSLDARVYRALFGKDFTVIPVGGHLTVMEYTRTLNDINWLNIKSYGIIDRDFLSSAQIEKYRGNNILVLDFNEIEMFLLCDEIMHSYMSNVFHEEAESRIITFKRNFWETFSNNIEQQVLSHLKSDLDLFLETQKITKFRSKNEITESLEEISKYDVLKNYDLIEKKYNTVILDKKYEELLKHCSLKGKISRQLANKYLDNGYIDKAISRIKNTPQLKSDLIGKYFADLVD